MTIGYSDFKIRCFLFNFPVPVVGCLGIIEITMIRSIMSRLTPPDKQGKFFIWYYTYNISTFKNHVIAAQI